MKTRYSILFLGVVMLASGCRIFKPGCNCPHVVSAAELKKQEVKRS
ncbi:hypothetical protein OQY15_19115 [Pedobacter sp. MC2016-15]|nr:hypothetical protein [Pedobacter sp. MC2016-15]MCX2481223.1 hypothetical protein [Pedobacter sp. MC2016-15]